MKIEAPQCSGVLRCEVYSPSKWLPKSVEQNKQSVEQTMAFCFQKLS
jgi:hypothetical protein